MRNYKITKKHYLTSDNSLSFYVNFRRNEYFVEQYRELVATEKGARNYFRGTHILYRDPIVWYK